LHVPVISPDADSLTAALAYAGAGWYVVPTRPDHPIERLRKSPGAVVGKQWEAKSSRDPGQIAGWYAGTNYGIALHVGRSGAVVFDVDDPAAAGLAELLAELDAIAAPVQTTSLDGLKRHYLVAMPAGRIIGNGVAGVGVAHIDIRGENGVIVVAPTPHSKATGRYAWLRPGPVPAPSAALAARMRDTARIDAPELDSGARGEWYAKLRPDLCRAMREYVGRIDWAARSRYETARDAQLRILRLGASGHGGAPTALAHVEARYRELVAGEARDPSEWRRAFEHGVDIAISERPTPSASCMCDGPPPLTGVALPVPPPAAPTPNVHLPPIAAPPLDESMAKLNELPAADRTAQARLIPAQLVDEPVSVQQEWRDALAARGDLSKGDFAQLLKAAVKDRQAAEQEAAEQARRAAAAERRIEAEQEGTLMPPPFNPMAAARHLADRRRAPDGSSLIGHWRGEFYAHAETHWRPWEDRAARGWIYRETEHATYDDGDDVKQWLPNGARVDGVLDALASSVVFRERERESDDRPDMIACRNGVYDVGADALRPHHPARFNLFSLPFDHDGAATCPHWLAFLDSVLPGDVEAHVFLQEWFGYVISGRTDLQKMASLFGPRRCGKGTIARVLEALLGSDAVASPTLDKLATQFGEAPLIGRRLATLSDVRWNARTAAEAVPILLAISGEDARNVPRKNRDDWHGKLGVRFMVLGNDAPTFSDASGALAGRMIHVQFRTSFFGREDPTLTGRLVEELPGILNWALAGLATLTARGRFAEPRSSAEAEELVTRLSSPVQAFLDDDCVMTDQVPLDELYANYRAWCLDEGRDYVPTKTVFGRELQATVGEMIRVERPRHPMTGRQYRLVVGIAITNRRLRTSHPTITGVTL
jgi:putative DNA primase/helicase